MYDRILVPTDGSAGTRGAIEHAARLAQVHEAALFGLYVINTASYASLPMETSWEGVGDMLRDEGQLALEEIASVVGDRDVPVETEIVEGSPGREIVEYAEAERCDLIVMGTHGRGGIDRLLLGSVTERVVRSASVPVLTMKLRGDSEPE